MPLPKTRVLEIIEAVQSRALSTGHHSSVLGAEPLAAAKIEGLALAVWVDGMAILPGRGLASASVLLSLYLRTYDAALTEYRDDIDPRMMSAVADLFELFVGGFTLDGFVCKIDIKGEYGNPLSTSAGHLTLDRKIFRIYDVIVPLVVDDLWTEAP